MKPLWTTLAGLACALCLVSAAHAQFAKPEDAIGYRQAVMTVMGYHFGSMGAVVKGEKPYDRDMFARDAALVQTLAPLSWPAFMVPGSDKGATTMKADAQQQKGKFAEAASAMEEAVMKLGSSARDGNLDASKTAFGAAAQSCKACHSQFRK
jgi:cytochrome c556